MKYIASCSGGKDSVATLILAKMHNEPLNEVVYCEVMFNENISGEVPEHRDFIYNVLKPWVETELNIPFTILRSKKTYVSSFYRIISRGDKKGKTLGFAIPGMCVINRDCKIPPLKQHEKERGDVIKYVGIAADEPKRLERLTGNKISLLAKYNMIEKEAMNLCKEFGLLSPIYEFAKRNGCWFCPNMHERELRHMVINHPELFDLLICMEKTTENIYRTRLTRTETPSQIKERILRNQQITIFD